LVTGIFGYSTWSTNSANFTMLSAVGATVGGTNDVSMVWDGNAYTSSSDYTGPGGAANVTVSSPTAFFGTRWTAHDIQVFVPGSYSFNTALGGGNPESGIMNVNVGFSQLGMHMLFDWSGNLNIDVVVVANLSSIFGAGIGRSLAGITASSANNCDAGVTKNCLWDGAKLGPDGKPAGSKVWMLSSADGNGDGIMGIPMAAGGPFQGFNANFNANFAAVPVPAAAWLFSSGLLVLLGMARKRKRKPA
jgi:hypothetical protein